MKNKSKIVLGIDLGTSNSQASYIKEGMDKPIIIKATDSASEFGKAFPSAIYKNPQTKVYTYGEAAKRLSQVGDLNNLAREFKKIIGVSDSNGKQKKIKFADEELTGIELSSKFLAYIKQVSEQQVGEEIKDCVITVPAAFDNARREATKNAAQIAGFNVLRLINEPTAAALAYKLGDKDSSESKNIAIFDIGGGTFDFTLLSVEEGALQVTASDGDLKLGGTYMDQALMEYILRDIEKIHKIKIAKGHSKYQDVLKEIEKVKIELTSIPESRLLVSEIPKDDGSGKVSYDKRLERSTLQRLISPLLSRISLPIDRCMKEAGISINDISHVVMVGGPSRIPSVVKKAEQIFGKEKICKDVNPMQCVSVGATMQGSIITGNTNDLLLVDVVPLSIGVLVQNGRMEKIILKGASLPCSNEKKFTNGIDFSKEDNSLTIEIFQGQRALASDNMKLGDLTITGLPKAKKATLSIDIALEVDRNGLLQVTANCTSPEGINKKSKAVISNSTSLTEEEIAKRIKDFEQNQKKDDQLKESDVIIQSIRGILEEIEFLKDTSKEVWSKYEEVEVLNSLITESDTYLSSSLVQLVPKIDLIKELKENLEKHLNRLNELKINSENNNVEEDKNIEENKKETSDTEEIKEEPIEEETGVEDEIL